MLQIQEEDAPLLAFIVTRSKIMDTRDDVEIR